MSKYMNAKLLPSGYRPQLSKQSVLIASDAVKRFVEDRLKSDLNLLKHPAPFAFEASSKINDDLDGSDAHKAVRFHISNITRDRGVAPPTTEAEKYGLEAEVVQSLANWKRVMLQWYGLEVGQGLFCESTSIRKGYKGDVTHSNIADQWDWELRIEESQRTIEFLRGIVNKIWRIIKDCEAMVAERFGLEPTLPDKIHFVTSEELHATWPDADIHGREDAAVNKWGAIFILGMGWPMKDGSAPEEIRSPSYDDWLLNGDIIVRHPVTGYRHELTSMGIRVDADALKKQLAHRGMNDLATKPYQAAVIRGDLPFCIGGGIGISRLLMLMLKTGHIGEVQVGVWHKDHHAQAKAAGIDLIPDRIL
ncbi:hypothetical protein CTAYLR_007349 [Chrysophaeum taylorii]|uniref:Aminoacyl-transfer RNA synthetases class-II family profile domain-containing protein n=1 Tax=Chrysophaeum taylorii TaxID=2483200 RepID=A0AAD7UKA8_9STRA|nr:hypothetical protein CTAYLR_007349 [Chrysophaeum taylorii]